ncbi:uncharacterized protein LOC105200593 [Solenopsis invicta]|uniref:uncharacterized protein LOC105200593 n=1 Tax=Solenopsis invicta TaxID=13686 RepID=UPI00193D764C|nr:uncharacterized protein LOC105200593 [Solenopsis invicta]
MLMMTMVISLGICNTMKIPPSTKENITTTTTPPSTTENIRTTTYNKFKKCPTLTILSLPVNSTEGRYRYTCLYNNGTRKILREDD